MAANSLTWTWDDFSGGEADGFKKGPQGSVRVTENVDCRSYDWGVILTKAPLSNYSYLGNVTAVSDVYTLSYLGTPAFAAKDGTTVRVYGNNAASSFTMGDAISAHNHILAFDGMWSVKVWGEGYFPYAFSNTNAGIGRVHKLTADYSWASYGVDDFTLPNWRTTAIQSIHTLNTWGGGILFAAWNGIYLLDTSEIVTLKLSLPAECDVVGFTRYQDSYRVYYTMGFTTSRKDSWVAYWDGDSTSFQSEAVYENTEILSVIQWGAYDYVTVGNEFYATLYAVWGLQFTEVRTTVGSSTANSRGFTKWWVSEEGKLTIPWKNKKGNYCLYEYGNEYKGQAQSLVSGLTSVKASTLNKKVSWVTVKGDTKYVWIDDAVSSGNSKFYTIPLNDFNAICVNEGEVATLPFNGLGPHTEKKLERVRVGYALGGTWNTIEIYARINASPATSYSSGWVLIGTCSDNAKNSLFINSNIINGVLGGYWGGIEFKAILKSANSVSPSIESIEIEYTDNLNN